MPAGRGHRGPKAPEQRDGRLPACPGEAGRLGVEATIAVTQAARHLVVRQRPLPDQHGRRFRQARAHMFVSLPILGHLAKRRRFTVEDVDHDAVHCLGQRIAEFPVQPLRVGTQEPDHRPVGARLVPTAELVKDEVGRTRRVAIDRTPIRGEGIQDGQERRQDFFTPGLGGGDGVPWQPLGLGIRLEDLRCVHQESPGLL